MYATNDLFDKICVVLPFVQLITIMSQMSDYVVHTYVAHPGTQEPDMLLCNSSSSAPILSFTQSAYHPHSLVLPSIENTCYQNRNVCVFDIFFSLIQYLSQM